MSSVKHPAFLIASNDEVHMGAHHDQHIVFDLQTHLHKSFAMARWQHRVVVCCRGPPDLMGDNLFYANAGSRPAHAEEPPLAKS